MIVRRIYLTRHGFRTNWSGESPRPHSSGKIPPDTPLSAHGDEQAEELAAYLATVQPPIDYILSSPFYRCIQTVEPLARRLNLPIIPELGLSEWYGTNRTTANDPQPAPPATLHAFCPEVPASYNSLVLPNQAGETIPELYARGSRALAAIISHIERETKATEGECSILLCTHAATFVALARVLADRTGGDPATAEFVPYTACVTMFERRWTAAEAGEGVGGSWVCRIDGDCSFLSKGRERGWRFSGKESFDGHVQKHGVDAGTGLGVIVEDGEGAPPQSTV